MDMQIKHLARTAKLLLLAVPFLSAQTAMAAAPEWVGGTSDAWENAANWNNPVQIPGVGDIATFNIAPPVNQPNITSVVTVDGLDFTTGATGNYTINDNGTLTITNGITNTSGVTQTILVGNADTLTLQGGDVAVNTVINNSVSNSVLNFEGDATAINATIDNTGTLDISNTTTGTTIGSLFGSGSVTFGDGKTLNLGGLNNDDVISGVMSGSNVQLNKNGTGTLTLLGGNSNLSGTTTVNDGVLEIGGNNFGTDIVVNNNSTLIFDRGINAINYSGVISDDGSNVTVEKRGSGDLTFFGANTYTGDTLVTEGRLRVEGNGNLVSNVNLAADTALVFDTNLVDITYPGVLTGDGKLIKEVNTSFLILSGDTTNFHGTVEFSGAGGFIQIGDGNTGRMDADIITQNATRVYFRRDNTTLTYANLISGIGSVYQSGINGTVIFTRDNTYSGSTIIEPTATLQLGNGGTSGNISSIIVNDGTLIVNRSNDIDLPLQITGVGDLIKQGAGTLRIGANDSLNGGLRIDAGSVQFGIGTGGSGSGQINGPISFNGAGASVDFNRSDIYTYDQPISETIPGSGSVINSGAGLLIFTGDSTYTGDTIINNGIFQLGNDSVSGSVAGNIILNNNTILRFDRSNDLTYNGVISGNGSVEKTRNNRLVFTGNNLYTGGTIIDQGILELGDGSSANGSVTGNIANDGTLRFNHAVGVTPFTFNGVISGVGSLEQNGYDVLVLNGDNTYTGLTTINRGTLLVGGSAANNTARIFGNVAVKHGATLGGHGIIHGDVANNGTVSPGASHGTLTIQGDYTQFANGTYFFETHGADADLLNISGSATLDGTLQIDASNGFVPGNTYTVLNAASVTGTFHTVTGLNNANLNFITAQVDYGTNTVTLAPAFNAAVLATLGQTPNQRAFINYLVASNGTPALASRIAGLSSTQSLLDLTDQLNGASYGNQQLQLGQTARWFERQLSDRMDLYPQCRGKMDAKSISEWPHNCDRHTSLWVLPYGSSASIDSGDASGLDTGMGGVAVGVDFPVGDRVKLGAATAASYFSSDATGYENASDDGMLYQFGVYGDYHANNWLVGAGVSVGGTDNISATRTIDNVSVNGSYSASVFAQHARAAYDIMLQNGVNLRPFVGLVNQEVSGNSFTETGDAGYTLNVQPNDYNSLKSQLGASVQAPMGPVIFLGSAAWQHEFEDTTGSINANLASNTSGNSYTVSGESIGRESALVKAGFVVLQKDKVNVSVLYEGVFADSYTENGGKLQLDFNLG